MGINNTKQSATSFQFGPDLTAEAAAHLRRRSGFVLLGISESGKTTLLNQIRYEYIPGYFQARERESSAAIYKTILDSFNVLVQAVVSKKLISQKNAECLDKYVSEVSRISPGLISTSTKAGSVIANISVSTKPDTPVTKHKRSGKVSRVKKGLKNTLRRKNSKAKMKATELKLTPHLASLMKQLWSDSGFIETWKWENRKTLNVLDSLEYFMDKVVEMAESNYVPTRADVLHSFIRTTGILEIQFCIDKSTGHIVSSDEVERQRNNVISAIKNSMMDLDIDDEKFTPVNMDELITLENFTVEDVGGARSERRKWERLDVQSNPTTGFFFVPTSDYDKPLFEDGKATRLEESLSTFKKLLENPMYDEIPFFLVFNKIDLLKKRYPEDAVFQEKLEEVQKVFSEALTEERKKNVHFRTLTAVNMEDCKKLMDEALMLQRKTAKFCS